MKHEWESRKRGNVIVLSLTIILLILKFMPWVKEWEWVKSVTAQWYLPALVWICILCVVWIIGRVILYIFKLMK